MREEGRSQSTKLNTFKNILEQELDSNFDDSIVIGGIDAFIGKWKVELSSNLGDLPSYSKLSKSKNRRLDILVNVSLGFIAVYEIDMKRILKKNGTTYGLANGSLLIDNKKIYEAENLKVGLFK